MCITNPSSTGSTMEKRLAPYLEIKFTIYLNRHYEFAEGKRR